jgi:signal transduction histidine kinase
VKSYLFFAGTACALILGAILDLGLRNLEERAQGLGGSFEVAPMETAGTRVRWRVPMS